MTVHEFSRSLARSHTFADAPWWEPVYRAAFPSFRSMRCMRADGWAQRGGIDRYVDLADGTSLKVDEKVRDRDWPDVALERWSDRERQVPGWVQKPLTCDYIAYAFVPSRRCYLLPFQTLRAAWVTNGRDWIDKAERCVDGFQVILADNDWYVTESIAVPTDVLLRALVGAMTVTWPEDQGAA